MKNFYNKERLDKGAGGGIKGWRRGSHALTCPSIIKEKDG